MSLESMLSDLEERFGEQDVKYIGECLKRWKLSGELSEFVGNTGTEPELAEMQSRIGEIHKEALELLTLVKVGNRVGLEDKSKQLLSAGFVANRQLERLSRALGVNLKNGDSTREYVAKQEGLAEDVAELVIDSYGSLLSEVKAVTVREVAVELPTKNEGPGQSETKETGEKQVERYNDVQTVSGGSIGLSVPKEVIAETAQAKVKEAYAEDTDNEAVEFGGGADLSALERFIGN